jgi:hypothetical protein
LQRSDPDAGLAPLVHDVRMAPKKAAADAEPDPDRLIRQKAGSYRTEDGRFEVEQADVGWFVVDTEQANELGLPLTLGPFATLKAVSEALPGARKVQPLPRRPARAASAAKAARTPAGATAKAQPPPPKSWIDALPEGDARDVRALIRALEREGLTDAEQLARRDREGLGPEVATRLIELRLDALVEDLPADARKAAREFIRRVAEVISAEGGRSRGPLPGWALVEIADDGEPPNRRIIIR